MNRWIELKEFPSAPFRWRKKVLNHHLSDPMRADNSIHLPKCILSSSSPPVMDAGSEISCNPESIMKTNWTTICWTKQFYYRTATLLLTLLGGPWEQYECLLLISSSSSHRSRRLINGQRKQKKTWTRGMNCRRGTRWRIFDSNLSLSLSLSSHDGKV